MSGTKKAPAARPRRKTAKTGNGARANHGKPAQNALPSPSMSVDPEAFREAADKTFGPLRGAMSESATRTAQGALEVHGKMIEAFRAQGDAAFDLWRATLAAGSLSEAIRLQASGVRQAYDMAASHWHDMARTTAKWLDSSTKPIRAVWGEPSR